MTIFSIFSLYFQKLVLITPLVYANEVLRYALTTQIPSMPTGFSLLGLAASIVIMVGIGFMKII